MTDASNSRLLTVLRSSPPLKYISVNPVQFFAHLSLPPPGLRARAIQAMTNSDFKSAFTSGFHTESSKSRSREPSLDMLLLLLLRPALRLGSHWYGARWSRLAFLRSRFCCINSCRRSTLQRVARFSVCRTRSPGGLHMRIWLWHCTSG